MTSVDNILLGFMGAFAVVGAVVMLLIFVAFISGFIGLLCDIIDKKKQEKMNNNCPYKVESDK